MGRASKGERPLGSESLKSQSIKSHLQRFISVLKVGVQRSGVQPLQNPCARPAPPGPSRVTHPELWGTRAPPKPCAPQPRLSLSNGTWLGLGAGRTPAPHLQLRYPNRSQVCLCGTLSVKYRHSEPTLGTNTLHRHPTNTSTPRLTQEDPESQRKGC